MTVVIDPSSAQRLIAEGALCWNVDAETDSRAVRPQLAAEPTPERSRLVLVCGTDAREVSAAVRHWERAGVAVWQVADGAAPCSCGHVRAELSALPSPALR